MASSTRQALAQSKAEISAYLGSDLRFSTDLFVAADAISANSKLRGILSDPSAEANAKSDLVERLFGAKLASSSIEFLKLVVAKRFSKGRDLVSVLEQLGVYAAASVAKSNNQLSQVQSDLFSFEQSVSTNRDLQFALGNKAADMNAKLELVSKLINGKVNETSEVLIRQALVSARSRRLAVVLDEFGSQIAAFDDTVIAKVTVASALDDAQAKKLQDSLTKTYGKQIRINVEIDPSIIGGLKVQIAGEIIDGSISSRLQNLKQQLGRTAASVNRS